MKAINRSEEQSNYGPEAVAKYKSMLTIVGEIIADAPLETIVNFSSKIKDRFASRDRESATYLLQRSCELRGGMMFKMEWYAFRIGRRDTIKHGSPTYTDGSGQAQAVQSP